MSGNVSDKCYVYFDVYSLAVINSLTEEVTSSSIKLTVNATSGTNPITKYYYPKDNGTTYTESTSNNYTFTGLSSDTTYNIKVYAVDEKGKNSEVYSKMVKTQKNEITFYINDNPYTALEGMTWQDWVTSDYHDNICDEYLYCLRQDGNRTQLMYGLSCISLSEKIVENRYYGYSYTGVPEIC